MSELTAPGPDPGNSDPSNWTTGLSEAEAQEVRDRLRSQFEPHPSDEADFNHAEFADEEPARDKTEEEQNAEFAEERARIHAEAHAAGEEHTHE